jgi:hypothetical protein
MGVAETSPSVPQRDGEGTYKLVGEPTPITLNGPRLGGSTHGYTSRRCTERRQMPKTCARHCRGQLGYCRCRLKLTPHTPADPMKKPCKRTHALARLRGLDRQSASATPRNSIAIRREECTISRHQHLRDPDGYTRRCSGATVGDSYKGPLNN